MDYSFATYKLYYDPNMKGWSSPSNPNAVGVFKTNIAKGPQSPRAGVTVRR